MSLVDGPNGIIKQQRSLSPRSLEDECKLELKLHLMSSEEEEEEEEEEDVDKTRQKNKSVEQTSPRSVINKKIKEMAKSSRKEVILSDEDYDSDLISEMKSVLERDEQMAAQAKALRLLEEVDDDGFV